MQHIGMQIAVTGAVSLLFILAAMKAIGDCPRMLIAIPILTAYWASWSAMVGGFLWWVWA